MSDSKDLLNGLPFPIGINVIKALSRYDRGEFAADIAIGNVPWLMAPNDDRPYSRVTTQFQRDRVDQASSAGEQSLSNWWIRSATSWHKGAGINYYDAVDDDLYRFNDSNNVDVWTQGQLSLLPSTDLEHAVAASQPATSGVGAWFISDGKVYSYEAGTGTVVEVAAFTAFTVAAARLCSDGSSAYVGAADGIYLIKADYSATKIYTAPGGAWTVQAIGYVKDRLIVGAQVTDAKPMRVFELGRLPAIVPTAVDLVTDSRYEFENTSLSFVDATEVTGAILMATTIGAKSRVLSFAVDTSAGGLSALLEPINVAEFPTGEVIRSLRSYLNAYVVVGTSRGMRIGTETANGVGFTYGPLTVQDDVAAIAFDGEYAYGTRAVLKDGTAGMWRAHLGTKVGEAYAYASDLSTSSSLPTGVALLGTTGRMMITSADGVWAESATQVAAAGYLTSGKIRFGTAERKQAVSMASLARQNFGVVDVTISNLEGVVATFSRAPDGELVNVALSADMRPSSENEITIEMTRGGSSDPGPIFEEWHLRALPAPQRSRTFTLPLMCWLEERDANGNVRVSDAWDRVKAMEYLEQTGGSCLYQNFATGEERICVIRAVQFEQTSPPSFVDGFGGIVTVQLQTVDTEVF